MAPLSSEGAILSGFSWSEIAGQVSTSERSAGIEPRRFRVVAAFRPAARRFLVAARLPPCCTTLPSGCCLRASRSTLASSRRLPICRFALTSHRRFLRCRCCHGVGVYRHVEGSSNRNDSHRRTQRSACLLELCQVTPRPTQRTVRSERLSGDMMRSASVRSADDPDDGVVVPHVHPRDSQRVHDTWTRGDGRVEIHVLPHQYQRLAPAVATA